MSTTPPNKPTSQSNWTLTTILGLIAGGIILGILISLSALSSWINSSRLQEEKATEVQILLTGDRISPISKGRACSLNYGCELDAAIFLGEINASSVKAVKAFLKQYPETERICFNSPGGNTDAAVDFSNLINQLNLHTCLADYYQINEVPYPILKTVCASSCNLTFLSSSNRVLVGDVVYFKGHSIAKNAHYEGVTPLNSERKWHLLATTSVGTAQFIDVINQYDYPESDEHKAYFEYVKSIGHLDDIKTLTIDQWKEFKIFNQQCGGKQGQSCKQPTSIMSYQDAKH